MGRPAWLVLENGRVFAGESFGAQGEVTGELVFTTGMQGYLETLTDPSYHGQIVLQTFPLIGNYGVISEDFESDRIGPCAYIVRHPCPSPSNFRSEGDLDAFLKSRNIPGLFGIDTRALTLLIRESGVMNGRITLRDPGSMDRMQDARPMPNSVSETSKPPIPIIARKTEGHITDIVSQQTLVEIRSYRIKDAVPAVSIREKRLFPATQSPVSGDKRFTVALLDLGMKSGIRQALQDRGCDVWVFPSDSSVPELLEGKPDAVMLSNGPGDPADNVGIIETVRELFQTGIPLLGVCLGHQLLALARGFATHKLKYGHRGVNQPVRNLRDGRVYMTSQNHGYAVTAQSIDPAIAEPWFDHVNDGTSEGLIYRDAPALSVQFHPEARSGPLDTAFVFDQMIRVMEGDRHAAG